MNEELISLLHECDQAGLRSHQPPCPIAQALGAAFDVGWGVGVDFGPGFAAVGAAEDVEALLVDDHERALVAGDDEAFGDGGREVAPGFAVGAGAGFFAAEPKLAAHDAQSGALRAGGVRAVPGLAVVGARPRVRGVFVGHHEQLAVALERAATDGGIETFRREPFPGLARIIAGEEIAKLRAGVAAIVTEREEAPAGVATIHRADVMRAQLAPRIVFELPPHAEGIKSLPEVGRGGKGHVAAGDKSAFATRDAPRSGHHAGIALALRQL